MTATRAAVEDFRKHGVDVVYEALPGGHEFKFFRRAMANCIQLLFK